MMNYEAARQQMLSQQIRTWDVLDERVLGTLRDTPREAFVPEDDRDLAFADTEIPLAHEQYMMSPKVEARLLQELAIEPADAALEIGTGSGYLTACLANLAGRVDSLEIFADLSESAALKLARLDISNVVLRDEDAMSASFDNKFDVIALTASLPSLDRRFVDLLNPGGRLFAVLGKAPVMEAVLIRRHSDGSWTQKSLFETQLKPMINCDMSEPFVL
jgi:protein-L-isoaspartate(D-aspartate) O-methyltransferase